MVRGRGRRERKGKRKQRRFATNSPQRWGSVCPRNGCEHLNGSALQTCCLLQLPAPSPSPQPPASSAPALGRSLSACSWALLLAGRPAA
eukprot:746072-Hanusia_phi.AAC.1